MSDNYNDDIVWTLWDVDWKQMWNSMIDEELLWWVCRHIHSEVSILAEWLWMTAWMITTNAWWDWWWAHAISLLKKEDWSFAIIDYWDIYEWRNFEELQSSYLDQKWSSLLQQMITDPEWNILRFFQTDWSELFWKNLSALWTLNTLEESKEIAKKWLVIQGWLDIKFNTWSSTDISATYWNWTIEVWASYNNDNSWLYKNYESYSVHTKAKLLDRKWIWEFWALLKISEHNFDYYSWKENSYNWLSVAWTYSKELVNTDEMKVDLWFAWQINAHWKKWNLSDWPSSLEASIWWTVVWEYYLNKDITLKWNLGIWWEWWWNMRSEDLDTLRLYWKHSVWAWIDYKWDWYIAWVEWNYEKWLWYKKILWEWYIDIWDIKLTAWYSKNSDITKFNIWDDVSKYVWFEVDITDTLNIKSNYSESDSYWTKSDNFYVLWEWKF